ncbi:efflux RND transporter permease subunit [Reinekea blandensis]|uniref:Probable integral membrane protein n=1 Tax=Reinekea blandensis MED297 TaxID=314283 RepID=A4BC59_9GAMM|nr:MMPL family transporter [Reinekea blandensis]EAR10125.1 probable integral membrane protein [Reinekea sp. MED297] [Reinekea blandensis MED297]
MFTTPLRVYETVIREKSHWLIFWVLVGLILLGFQARNFTLDASAESLLLEKDPALDYFREISERYGSQDFLILTFTPDVPLFSESSLSVLTAIRDEIRQLERVASVVSVMDVPLLSNPPVPMTELVSNIKTLEDPETDLAMARSELANSPLYVNLLLNLDENTTALQINFPFDQTKSDLLSMRDNLRRQVQTLPDSGAEKQLELVDELIFEHNADAAEALHQDIESIRSIMTRYDDQGELHLGGVPMIADDIIRFVRSDLIVFGVGVVLLVVVTLWVIFRQARWVFLPLLCSGSVVVAMLGLLGWWQWPATVISSNFISLLLILTLSMNIHLIVRYRELLREHPDWDQRDLVIRTVRRIAIPCVYMTLTTGVAFVSLVSSGIRPVINFGWMMTVGILVSFLMTFAVFPAMLMMLGKNRRSAEAMQEGPLTRVLARFTLRNGRVILLVSALIAAFTIIGASQLLVENSFIDYFDEETEIYQGMTVIDQRLGGTTPLEVILRFNGDRDRAEVAETPEESQPASEVSDPFVDDFVTEDEFVSDTSGDFIEEDFLSMDEGDVGRFEDDFVGEDDPDKYWFTTDKVEDIKKIHQYLDALPQTGKVISLATMMEIAESFNDGEPLTNIQLALLYSVIPEEFRAIVVDPYVSVEHNEARLNVRILDSMQGLQRDALLRDIEQDLVEVLGFEVDEVRLTGMMVLYNNMLQSLFSSQVLTLGGVFIGILLMFLLLFRNLTLALIAMVPNLLAATLVLGVMGWLGIPLDIMTITIASITIGIAVDNTIHYIVRYRREYERDHNYAKALRRAHKSIGKAIFYTSVTIIMGFSILTMSNFKPTIYFGLLTALAMTVALLGSLTLLPRLILLTRPFAKGSGD